MCGAKAEGRVDKSREIQTNDGRCGMGMLDGRWHRTSWRPKNKAATRIVLIITKE